MTEVTVKSAVTNPAIAHCWKAWCDTYNAYIGNGGKRKIEARRRAGSAFRQALPPLLGARNTRQFIACVTYGAVVGILSGGEASRLLYAAQVAHTTRRTRKPPGKAQKSSAEKSHSGANQAGISAIQEPSSEPAQAA